MADPLQNLQAMQALFQQPANAFSRSQSARLNMALNNLRRVQELEDQQAQTNARMKLEQMADTRARDLANLQRSTQMQIAEVSEQKADRRAEASENRADLRAKAADERADARNEAAEKKALRAAVRAAYERYTSAGGTKKLSEFGAEDDANTLYSLQGEIGKIQSALEDEKFGQAAELLKQQEQKLSSLISPSKAEIEQVEVNAVNALGSGPTKDAFEFYTDAIADGVPHSVAVQSMLKTYPGAAPLFQSAVSSGVSEVQAAKMKSPEFVKGLDQLGKVRSTMLEQAMSRQRPGGSQLLRSLIAPDPQQSAQSGDGRATVDGMGLSPSTSAVQQAVAPAVAPLYGADSDPLIAEVNQRRQLAPLISDYRARNTEFEDSQRKLDSLKSLAASVRSGSADPFPRTPNFAREDIGFAPEAAVSDMRAIRLSQILKQIAEEEDRARRADAARISAANRMTDFTRSFRTPALP